MHVRALCLAALSFVTLRAQSITLVEETFADGDRTNQNLPTSLAWYTSNAARSNLAIRGGALTLVAINNDRNVWGHFPAVALNVGESLTLTVNFQWSRTQANLATPGFKIALCHSNGLPLRRTDGTMPTGGYQGYGNFTNPGDGTSGTVLRKRNGPAAARTTATLLEVTDGASDVIWTALRSGLNGIQQGNTPYVASLRITRTVSDTATITTSILGGTLSPVNTLTEVDAADITSVFDTLAIGAAESTQAGDLSISRVQLVHEVNNARLVNLSVRSTIATSGDSFTLGYVIGGGGTSGAKPLVIRAAGPSLAAFGVGDALVDPRLELFAGTTRTGENDN